MADLVRTDRPCRIQAHATIATTIYYAMTQSNEKRLVLRVEDATELAT
jgi:hypothetical protein